MSDLKILILIKRFADKWPKHKHKFDMINAIEKFANVYYWHEDGHIRQIINNLDFKPDFILHYDIEWNYVYSPKIEGLGEINIPKGCYVLDLHYSKKTRRKYFEGNKVDLIFSACKNPFLEIFPEYKQKFRWMPFSVNEEIIKDWKLEKDIDFLLMGQLFYEDKKNPPKRLPPKGRYKFREEVLRKMKNEKDFVFFPHPGHYVSPSNNIIVNEKYAKTLNRSKIFFTCGGSMLCAVAKYFEAPGCRSLLFAKPNKDVHELGFSDGINFVECNELDFYDKAMYYIKNDKERERITKNGYDFIHTCHTNTVRAKQLVNCILKSI